MNKIDKFLIAPNTAIREAINAIEISVAKIALVVDSHRKLLGTVTDGDIRRGILRGISLEDSIQAVMNEHPAVAGLDESRNAILNRMRRERYRQMPIVDDDGRVVRVEVLTELLEDQKRDNPVVLMAGGIGERLMPLTSMRPKPLLEIGNKPILESILESFVERGFHHFYISVNYKREMLEEYFGDGSRWGVTINYLREEIPLGTAGALTLLPELPQHPVVVMNGDVLTKVDFDHLLAYHAEHDSTATIAVREYDHSLPYGVIEVKGHCLVSIREKPIIQFLVNAGIYVFEPEVLSLIPRAQRIDMPQLLTTLLEQDREVSVFPIREYWIDIGRKEDFDRANGEFDSVFR